MGVSVEYVDPHRKECENYWSGIWYSSTCCRAMVHFLHHLWRENILCIYILLLPHHMHSHLHFQHTCDQYDIQLCYYYFNVIKYLIDWRTLYLYTQINATIGKVVLGRKEKKDEEDDFNTNVFLYEYDRKLYMFNLVFTFVSTF